MHMPRTPNYELTPATDELSSSWVSSEGQRAHAVVPAALKKVSDKWLHRGKSQSLRLR